MNELCEDCVVWKVYGKKCRNYWEGKIECCQYLDGESSEPKYKCIPKKIEWNKLRFEL